MDTEFKKLIDKFNAGRAILFTGSGFSSGNIDLPRDEPITLPELLALKISEIGQIPPSKNLSYVVNRFFNDNVGNTDKCENIISLLKREFTVKSVSETVESICKAPWSKFYTTNYDNSLEIAVDGLLSIDTCMQVETNEIKDKRCVHINGYIGNLNLKSLDKSFMLSGSSYISTDNFLNSAWYTVFKRDLQRCSMLVFAGCLFNDIDIKKILVDIPGLKEKTFFVVNDGCTDEEKYILAQKGNVLSFGIDYFGAQISKKNNFESINIQDDEYSIKKYSFEKKIPIVHDRDIEKLLIVGLHNKALIESDVLSGTSEYVVVRESTKKVLDHIKVKNIIITGDLGNGKSIFINECLPMLVEKYSDVYLIDHTNIDYFSDMLSICNKNNDIKIFVIENYFQHIDLIENLSSQNLDNVRFLLTARSGKHERLKEKLASINFFYEEVSIDILTVREGESLSSLIDSVGFWGSDFINNTQKRDFIAAKCRNQISPLLLCLLDSPNIKSKIKKILGNLISVDDDLKKTTVTVLFVAMHDIKADLSLLSYLIGNFIYDRGIIENEHFRGLFHIKNCDFEPISSVFCQKIIKDFVSPSYVLPLIIEIAKKLNSGNKSSVEKTLLKSCFKFSTIESILPDTDDKLTNIINYYEKLKRAVPWLIDDPHFWMQYAMGHIACNDYEKAQILLNQAYGKAKNRVNYDTYSIDTQQARLYFLLATKKSETTNEAIATFQLGHLKIKSVLNTIYKYRQLYLYEYFYNAMHQRLSPENKSIFCKFCNEIIGSITFTKELYDSNEDNLRQRCIEMLKNIISHIKDDNHGVFTLQFPNK